MTASAAALASPPVHSADGAAKLEAIAASGACAEGRVFTLDFQAIRTRLGDRWEPKRENIQAKLESIIEKHASHRSIWLRTEECEYLVCFAEESGGAAQAISFRAVEEALTFFLGSVASQDVQVSSVTSLAGGVIVRVPIAPGETACAFPSMAGVRKMIPTLAKLASPVLIDDTVERYRLSCGLEEVVNLKRDVTVGCRVAPKFFSERSRRALTVQERAALSTRALMTMDCRVVKTLSPLLAEGSAKMLIAPLSLHTFSASSARLLLVEELNRLDDEERDRLVIELVGFEAGTPASRLVETASLLRPFCRYVMAQATPGRSGIVGAGAARLPAMSVCSRELGGESSRLAAGLLAFGQAAQALSSKLVATDLPGEGFLDICGVAGFTLATIARADFG